MKKLFLNNILFIKWNYFNLICLALKKVLINNILMLSFFNNISFLKTILDNFCYYYSRSKNIFWFKGLKSKNFQILKELNIDCDMDFIIVKIFQLNNTACHTGYYICNQNKIYYL